MANYVYAFDCVGCYHFYGENSLTIDGRLYCPNCLSELDKESVYVEKIRVGYTPEAFSLEETN